MFSSIIPILFIPLSLCFFSSVSHSQPTLFSSLVSSSFLPGGIRIFCCFLLILFFLLCLVPLHLNPIPISLPPSLSPSTVSGSSSSQSHPYLFTLVYLPRPQLAHAVFHYVLSFYLHEFIIASNFCNNYSFQGVLLNYLMPYIFYVNFKVL
uniref:Uncharacterized protein n=1 Tax=Cacopsylla melanoneura TaxID=428564 RepID=A0A8D9AQR8_9HEMI